MVTSNESRKCIVHLLDDQKLDIPLQPKLLSSELLAIVASHFNLKEKEYFGLCFTDSRDNTCWLRSDKKALDHDFPKTNPIVLYFSVRNYTESITILKDNSTVELFYLQACKLIFKGDVECDSGTVFLLAADVLQATHGDYVSDAIAIEDLKGLNVMPMRTLQEHPSLPYCEKKIIDHYRDLDGLSRGEAVVNYLSIVERLPMYGVHYFDVKDKDQIPWKLGLSHRGVAQYDYHDKTVPRKTYAWNKMENLYYRDKKFSLEFREGPRITQTSHVQKANSNNSINRLRRSLVQQVHVYAWYSPTSIQCREIWTMGVSQHQFYLDKRPTHRTANGQRSLKEMAKNLSKSSTSLSSMYSSSSVYDNISDTTSFYFSLDGDSVSSSQMMAAEQDMLSALKARKMFLEQQLIEKRELLNEICLREAELTGVVPSEIPESPTHPGKPMRRKVGTSFEFDESLLSVYHNLEGREYDRMQRDYEIQRQITSAAQRLAMDPSTKKKVRKNRQLSYETSLVKLKTMEQQLDYLKREVAKETREGLSMLSKKDDGNSNADSVGPIDVETSSNKSYESSSFSTNNSTLKRRPRNSMYFANPIVSTSTIPINILNNFNRSSSSSLNSSIISPRHNGDLNSYHNNRNHYENNLSVDSYLPARTYNINSRSRNGHPSSPLARVKSQFHNSADQLNELISPRSNTSGPHYISGEFENTGLYSMSITKKTDCGSNPTIPHSFSSGGISRMHASPMTLRRLQQLSASPSQGYTLPSRYISSQSQGSLEGSEQSESWSDVASEETLV